MSQRAFTSTAQVLERYKIHISHEVRNNVPFLSKAKGPVTAVAVPGGFGGIQIFFEGLPFSEERQRIETSHAAKAFDLKGPVKSGLCWQGMSQMPGTLRFLFTKTVVLPSPARALGLLPREGEDVLLFTYGNIFEIWKPADWNTLQLKTRERIELLAEDVPDMQSTTSD